MDQNLYKMAHLPLIEMAHTKNDKSAHVQIYQNLYKIAHLPPSGNTREFLIILFIKWTRLLFSVYVNFGQCVYDFCLYYLQSY